MALLDPHGTDVLALLLAPEFKNEFRTKFRRTSLSTICRTTYTHPLVDAFQSRLNSELRLLQESGESYLSTEWLGQALEVCVGIHSQAEELFPHIRQAVLHENPKLVDEQLDATVNLLDVCNALKETICDIKEYQASLKMIVREVT